MNKRLSILLSWCTAAISAVFMTACVDEIPGYGYDIPEGEVMVELQTAFTPFTESILSRSTTIPGKAMQDLSDLCILAYGTDGKLIRNECFPDGVLDIKFEASEVKDEDRVNDNASNGSSAEAATKCLKKALTLPTGRYYLIAVANLGEYTRNEDGSITTHKTTYEALTDLQGKYRGKYDTLDELRSMTVSWDLGNDANNREMLGYFTDSKDNVPSSGSQFTTIAITRSGQSLHAWLRRCASKVTIDFDGSGLRENVRVYLKEARIYDIPKTCTLGFGRGGDDASVNFNNAAGKDGIYTASEVNLTNAIIYGEGNDHKQWPAITKGTPYGAYIEQAADNSGEGSNNRANDFPYGSLHSETADALFFYENMQGNAPRDKFQIADLNNGGVQGSKDIKDGMEYGTYIEVVGYYYNTTSDAMTEGEIRYRFMLGKDIKRNCDAERNYHYKLTLKLRGNANDYDWHIDYKDTKGFDIPNPWYVSYLYNHDATLPFKYTPIEGYAVKRIKAEILENPWYPVEIPKGEDVPPYNASYLNSQNKHNGNGFLSLRKTGDVVITPQMSGYEKSDYENEIGEFQYAWNKLANMNDNYYYGNSDSNSDIDRSTRTYYFDESDDETNIGLERYSYNLDGNKYTFNIPLFTRAKVLIKQTGYSGNNPFVGYERHAKLRIIAECEDDKKNSYKDTVETTVIQVRRIVNPKGVYRRAGNNQDFNVTLMRLPGDDEPEFVEFDSDGPWMAEIIGDKNFITLDGKQIVTGSTKTPIKFQIRFNKLNGKNTPTKNAVVRVRYHNYTCVHLIFVRQGYDDMELCKEGVQGGNGEVAITTSATKWSLFNMIAKDIPATDPRDEGSLFKYANEDEPIDASCNVYRDGNGNPKYTFPTEAEFKTPPAIKQVISVENNKVTTKDVVWDSIGYNPTGSFSMDVATVRDFEQLYLTPNVQFGYGVLYADGATNTQSEVSYAYGWSHDDLDNTKGMRGMFVYYWDRNHPEDKYNARNMFFPIGRSGYGHRKHRGASWEPDTPSTLRYSCLRNGYKTTFEVVAPLFSNLYRRPGAIYWAKNKVTGYLDWSGTLDATTCVGLDINYFTFDVNGIGVANVLPTNWAGTILGSDACFVRCVKR